MELLQNFVPKKNIFQYAYIISREFRKNVEQLNPKDYILKYKEMFNYFGADYFRGSFFLIFNHRIYHTHYLKSTNTPNKRLENVEIDGNEYYPIQFKKKELMLVEIYSIYMAKC